MKKFIPILIIVLFAFQCKKDEPKSREDIAREHAWEILSDQQKSTVISNWETVPVMVTIYDGKKAYKISYRTNQDDLLGPIIIYLDYYKYTYLGMDPRD